MNPEAEYRVTAQLLGLAEAVAELANEYDDPALRRYARNVVAGYQHTAMTTTADPRMLALYRHEAGRMLRSTFGHATG